MNEPNRCMSLIHQLVGPNNRAVSNRVEHRLHNSNRERILCALHCAPIIIVHFYDYILIYFYDCLRWFRRERHFWHTALAIAQADRTNGTNGTNRQN